MSKSNLISWDGLRQIANDLTKLEINTIVKSELTGQKMPESAFAVLSIAKNYDDWLSRHGSRPLMTQGQDLSAIETQLRLAVSEKLGSREYARIFEKTGPSVFQSLSSAAQKMRDNTEKMAELRTNKLDGIPQRIKDSSDFLIKLIQRYADDLDGANRGEMIAGDALSLRKIWEIGTEVVVLQTVIQLDGDVITYVRDPKLNSDDPILKLHQTSVQNATDSWQFLVKTVGSVASNLIGIFKP